MHFPLPQVATNLTPAHPFTARFLNYFSQSFAHNDPAQNMGIRTSFWEPKKLIYVEFEPDRSLIPVPPNPHHPFANRHDFYRQLSPTKTLPYARPMVTVIASGEGKGHWEKDHIAQIPPGPNHMDRRLHAAALATMQAVTGQQSIVGSFMHVLADFKSLQTALQLLSADEPLRDDQILSGFRKHFAKPVMDAFVENTHYRESAQSWDSFRETKTGLKKNPL